MKNKIILRPADIAVAAAVLLIGAAVLLINRSGTGKTANIISGGETLYTIDLEKVEEEYTIGLDTGIVIEVKKDGIRFLSSTCPGQDCVKCGWLKNPGQTAACLPNKTVITVTGRNADRPDAVAY